MTSFVFSLGVLLREGQDGSNCDGVYSSIVPRQVVWLICIRDVHVCYLAHVCGLFFCFFFFFYYVLSGLLFSVGGFLVPAL